MEDFTDDLFKGGINDYNQKAQLLNDYLINQYNGTENLAVLLDQYFNLNNSKLNTFINVMSQYEDDFDNPQFIDQLTQQIIIFEGNFNNRNINTRGIFAGLASFFGAGDCVQSVLNVVDTCVHVGAGIITAPTGVGAVLNWGSAVVSYGLAMEQGINCINGN